MKIPCKHKCHTKYGSRSRSGHERSPKSKIPFRTCRTCFIVTFSRRIKKNRSHFGIWLHASQQQRWVRSTLGHMRSNFWFFLKYKMCFSEPVWSQDSKKCNFYCCAMSKNAQNRSLKNDVINGYRFWAMCLPKIDMSTWNLACQISKRSSTTYNRFFFLKI